MLDIQKEREKKLIINKFNYKFNSESKYIEIELIVFCISLPR